MFNFWESQAEQLAQLGRAWLARGASGLCLRADGEVVWRWPQAAEVAQPDVVAEMATAVGPSLELGLCGGGAADGPRLQADAQFLSQAVNLEFELEMMTGELIETQDQLLALYDLTRSTRSHLEVPDTLQSVVAEVARLVKVDSSFAVLQAPPEWPQLVVCHPGCALAEAQMLALFAQAQATGGELLLQGADVAGLLPPGARNLLVVPVQVRGEVLAALGFVNRQLGDFQSPDLKLIRAIAEQAGAQVENALLLHETLMQARLQTEMRMAQEVQLQLLPQKPPRVLGLDLFASSLPALQVGGDFFDFIVEAGRPLIFTVGDVSGKGVSSALLMTMIRTVLRGAGKFDATPTPQSLLDRANRDLYDDFTEVTMFATVFVGQYDAARRCLTYANAGHSPVVFCPAGGAARLLEADGTAVG
ncbi:MAG: SpoIIE family protein phosphatase, partial [Anaerolineales bacterium]|nr:SpoIIE family protein phosphatase [Anaerolineales bacterium]